jgi:hypothetical protein
MLKPRFGEWVPSYGIKRTCRVSHHPSIVTPITSRMQSLNRSVEKRFPLESTTILPGPSKLALRGTGKTYFLLAPGEEMVPLNSTA